jgi:uncharacterized protein (DUF1499 family)
MARQIFRAGGARQHNAFSRDCTRAPPMMTILKWLLVALAVVVLGAIGAGQAGLFQGNAPPDLGVRDGRLKAPSNTDNSVTSQAALYPDHPQRLAADIAPLALRGDGAATLEKLRQVVAAMDGAKIVRSDADYLYAQYTTTLMRFVDDVEFWYDPRTGVIQVRSASRVGKSDMGVNRRRIEAVRAALATAP